MSTTVILADDHQMMREGLRSLLEKEPRLNVVGEAADGRAAVALAEQLSPDVVVMDVGMPDLNGIEATRMLQATCPDVRVVALSMHADKRYALRMLQEGALGYVLKGAASEELLRAIESAMRGQNYLSPEIAGVVIDDYIRKRTAARGALLAPREREVLQLLAEGKTSKEIATTLDMAVKTVETHRRNIMDKVDLHSVAELTKYAIREGLTSL